MAATRYADISTWLNPILQATDWYLKQATIMPSLVQTFGDTRSSVPRKADTYSAGTVGPLTEGDQITSFQSFSRTAFGTVTPSEVGTAYLVTDQRRDSDNVANIMADVSEHIGYTFAKAIDTSLLAAMGSMTGGSLGGGGSTLTWDLLFAAYSRLRATGVPGPYNAVLHEYQWYSLSVNRGSVVPLIIEETIRRANRFYVGSFGDLRIFTTGIPAAGTAVKAGVFAPKALVYDVRRPVRIEVERSATYRGDLIVATHIYGASVWRGEYGIVITANATAPTG